MRGDRDRDVPVPAEPWSQFRRCVDELNFVDSEACGLVVVSGNSGALLERAIRGGVSDLYIDVVDVLAAGTKSDSRELADKLLGLGGAVGALATPWLGVAAAAGQLSLPLIDRVKGAHPTGAAPQAVILDALRTARNGPPRVLIFRDLSSLQLNSLWEILVYARQRFAWERALLVIEAGHQLTTSPMVDQTSQTLLSVSDAVASGLALQINVPALTDADVASRLGAVDADLVATLLAISGGDGLSARDVWERWTRLGYVEQRDGWRVVDEVEDLIEHDLLAVLQERSASSRDLTASAVPLSIVREMLDIASLSGPAFSAEAVAAVTAGLHPYTTDQLVDALDLLVPAGSSTSWLLEYRPCVRDGSEVHWIYSFASRGMSNYLSGSTQLADEVSILRNLLDALVERHENMPEFDLMIAETAQRAGDDALTRKHLARVRERRAVHQLLVRRQMLIAQVASEPLDVSEMMLVAHGLHQVGFDDEAVELCRLAKLAAERIGTEQQTIEARGRYGQMLCAASRWTEARQPLEEFEALAKTTMIESHVRKDFDRFRAGVLIDLSRTLAALHERTGALEAARSAVEVLRLTCERDDDAHVTQDLASALSTLGQRYCDLGDHGGGIAAYLEAVALQSPLVPDAEAVTEPILSHDDVMDIQSQIVNFAELLMRFGLTLDVVGRRDEAVEAISRAVEVSGDLFLFFPESPSLAHSYASAMYHRGLIASLNDREMARGFFSTALDVWSKIAPSFATSAQNMYHIALANLKIGETYERGDPEFYNALRYFEMADSCFESVIDLCPDDLSARSTHLQLVICLSAALRWSEALPEADASSRRAMSLATSLVAAQPTLLQSRHDLIMAQLCRAQVLRAAGQAEEAKAMARSVIAGLVLLDRSGTPAELLLLHEVAEEILRS